MSVVGRGGEEAGIQFPVNLTEPVEPVLAGYSQCHRGEHHFSPEISEIFSVPRFRRMSTFYGG
jgi:hypothetical protein